MILIFQLLKSEITRITSPNMNRSGFVGSASLQIPVKTTHCYHIHSTVDYMFLFYEWSSCLLCHWNEDGGDKLIRTEKVTRRQIILNTFVYAILGFPVDRFRSFRNYRRIELSSALDCTIHEN